MPRRMQVLIPSCFRISDDHGSVHPNDPKDAHIVDLVLWGKKLRKSQSLVTKNFIAARNEQDDLH